MISVICVLSRWNPGLLSIKIGQQWYKNTYAFHIHCNVIAVITNMWILNIWSVLHIPIFLAKLKPVITVWSWSPCVLFGIMPQAKINNKLLGCFFSCAYLFWVDSISIDTLSKNNKYSQVPALVPRLVAIWINFTSTPWQAYLKPSSTPQGVFSLEHGFNPRGLGTRTSAITVVA